MHGRISWLIFAVLMLCLAAEAYSQQDVDFHLNAYLFPGKNILKVKRDFYDPYLWVLAQNNEVYRVNSLTLAVDDYTSKFAAYNTLKFTDIAGRSQDTVFVATSSTSVIEYKKGIIKDIGKLPGISGTINQVGMDHIYYPGWVGSTDPLNSLILLMIATTTNIYYYDCVNEVIISTGTLPANNQLFETTYRTEVFSNLGFRDYFDDTKQYPILYKNIYNGYVGALFYNTPEFGYHVNTVYNIDDLGYAEAIYLTQLWGTENGLFQNNWDRSYYLTSSYQHYLSGIKVNKVTSIYGLTSFGSTPGLTKENLLVGTDQGFYFSNSGYAKYVGGPLYDYNTFTFDADVGKKVINDICVNATSYTKQICEDGAWVAANDGLYLLKPDYGKYLSTIQTLQAINFENQPATVTSTNLCNGSSVTAVVNTGIYTGNTLQWYKDGNELPAQSSNRLTINTAGDYYAVLYDPCGTAHLSSNHLKVTTTASPVFSFNYPDDIQQCGNAPFILKTDDNSGYQYRWYTNGVLNGNTASSYTATQSGKYKVEVSACTNSWVPSKEVEVDMITLPTPQISPDKPVYCAEDVATLSENAPVDATYTINWYLNGTVIPADVNLTSISTTTAGTYTVILTGTVPGCSQTSSPFQLQFTPAPTIGMFPAEARACNSETLEVLTPGGDNLNYTYRWYTNGVLNGSTGKQLQVTETAQYRVEVSLCQGSWVSSNTIQVDIVNLPPISVITTDKPNYCAGDNATLSLPIAADPSYTINWYRDNTLVAAYSNQTSITTNVAGSYTASVVNNAKNYDGTYCTETTAAAQTLSFDPATSVIIEKSANTSLCDGQTVNLSAHYSGGTLTWSTGQTTDQIAVTATGTYTATVTSPNGCTSTATADISFLPNPVLNISNAAVCSSKNQPITLVAPSGYAQYTWNGQAGTSTYQVNTAQTVTLTVTDANGCQATQQIAVADNCPDLVIPNTFTPNNDNINDYWVIEGVHNNADLRVRVFNRYGTKLYDNIGYGTPWNGEYGGRKVPAGVYYYLINVPSKNKTYSGPLTILY